MDKLKLVTWGIGLILLIGLSNVGWSGRDAERPFLEMTTVSSSTAEQPTVTPILLPTSHPAPDSSLSGSPEHAKMAGATPSLEKSFPCPVTSTNQYRSGPAYQFDQDDPVRPAADHADKNLSLRSYALITDGLVNNNLIDYGRDDPTQPPQLATLFKPYRFPGFINYYQVHHWLWSDAPDPGYRADSITIPPVTALGLQTAPGETLHTPVSGYDIGGGMAALVIFADEDTVALRYTREDSSGSRGYTIHVDQICTDPHLLLLYRALDAADGPRYQFMTDEQRPYHYNLPELAPGQPFGTVQQHEVVVAVVDSGTFMDPRSCDEWWQVRSSIHDCSIGGEHE